MRTEVGAARVGVTEEGAEAREVEEVKAAVWPVVCPSNYVPIPPANTQESRGNGSLRCM